MSAKRFPPHSVSKEAYNKSARCPFPVRPERVAVRYTSKRAAKTSRDSRTSITQPLYKKLHIYNMRYSYSVWRTYRPQGLLLLREHMPIMRAPRRTVAEYYLSRAPEGRRRRRRGRRSASRRSKGRHKYISARDFEKKRKHRLQVSKGGCVCNIHVWIVRAYNFGTKFFKDRCQTPVFNIKL